MRSSREAMKALLLTSVLWLACAHGGASVDRGGGQACGNGEAEVHLRVVDEQGQPLPDVRLGIWPEGARVGEGPLATDAAGQARLVLRVARGQAPRLTLTAEGRLIESYSLPLAPGEQRPLDVRLERAVSLSGRLVDAQGQPVPGAQVSGAGSFIHHPGTSTKTDAEGRFSLAPLPTGPVSLWAASDGLLVLTGHAVAPGTDLELRFEPVSSLRVEVRDAQGRPRSGVVLELEPVGTQGRLTTDSSRVPDLQGHARFSPLRPGGYRVRTSWEQSGFRWATSAEVTLGRAEERSVLLTVDEPRQRPRLTGRTVDGAGRPLKGIEVAALPPTGPAVDALGLSEHRWAFSGAEGRFTLAGLREGPVRLQVQGTYELAGGPVLEVPPGQDEVTLVVERRATLQGQVVDAEGRPVPLFSLNGREINHPEGRFENLTLPLGTAELVFEAVGFLPRRHAFQVTSRKQYQLPAPIVLQRGRTVRGRVLEANGCSPPSGVTLSQDAGPWTVPDLSVSTYPDAEGHFQLGPLPARPLRLRADRVGGRTSRFEVDADEDTVTVRLQPTGSVTGEVTGRDGRPIPGEAWVRASCGESPVRLDAAGRFTLHGLVAGEECFLDVLSWAMKGHVPPHRFTSRRVVIPAGGTLNVRLSARRGPATLLLETDPKDLQFTLLEGDVPLPGTMMRLWHRARGSIRGDASPKVYFADSPKDFGVLMEPPPRALGDLPLGRYTLFVWENKSVRPTEGLRVHRLPVELTAPGPTRLKVTLPSDAPVLPLGDATSPEASRPGSSAGGSSPQSARASCPGSPPA